MYYWKIKITNEPFLVCLKWLAGKNEIVGLLYLHFSLGFSWGGEGSFVLVGSQDVVVAGSRRLLGVHVQHCLCSGTALVASQGSQ